MRSVFALVARVIAWALSLKATRSFLLYLERRGPQFADAITYRTLFSVFAGVLLGFSLATLWLADNPIAWKALVDAVDAVIPGLVGEGGLIDPKAIQVPAGLTVVGVLGLVGLIGAAIGAIGSLRTALRVLAGRVTEDVQWYWVIVRNLALAAGIGAALVVSAALTYFGTVGVRTLLTWLGAPDSGDAATLLPRIVSLVIVFGLDACIVAVLFLVLAGVRPSARSLWTGALLGGFGLTVLQALSSLFVGGASANPLLASFAALIALLLWFNLSAQVILIAGAYIITGAEEEKDRVRAKFGATTFAQRRVQRAEDAVTAAARELDLARAAAAAERASSS
ncbi:YihY/virulence factor BrkB family protein [Microbacterium sp. X-17]|uniref:YihY/virulence factor BrkB family protein n=1 Tax=Microbacterium sp. X-17 TaxID=3144404 RepID=UPI0031F5B9AC